MLLDNGGDPTVKSPGKDDMTCVDFGYLEIETEKERRQFEKKKLTTPKSTRKDKEQKDYLPDHVKVVQYLDSRAKVIKNAKLLNILKSREIEMKKGTRKYVTGGDSDILKKMLIENQRENKRCDKMGFVKGEDKKENENGGKAKQGSADLALSTKKGRDGTVVKLKEGEEMEKGRNHLKQDGKGEDDESEVANDSIKRRDRKDMAKRKLDVDRDGVTKSVKGTQSGSRKQNSRQGGKEDGKQSRVRSSREKGTADILRERNGHGTRQGRNDEFIKRKSGKDISRTENERKRRQDNPVKGVAEVQQVMTRMKKKEILLRGKPVNFGSRVKFERNLGGVHQVPKELYQRFPENLRQALLVLFGTGFGIFDINDFLLPYVVFNNGNFYYRFKNDSKFYKGDYSLV